LLIDVNINDPGLSDLDAIKTVSMKPPFKSTDQPTVRSMTLKGNQTKLCTSKRTLSALEWFHALALKRSKSTKTDGSSVKSRSKVKIDVKPNTARVAPKNSYSDSQLKINVPAAQQKCVLGKQGC